MAIWFGLVISEPVMVALLLGDRGSIIGYVLCMANWRILSIISIGRTVCVVGLGFVDLVLRFPGLALARYAAATGDQEMPFSDSSRLSLKFSSAKI